MWSICILLQIVTMRLLHVWFANVFLSTVYATVNTNGVRFTENVVLENYISNNHAVSERVCSLAECGVTCDVNELCASFSHSNTTMKCKIYSTVFRSNTNLLFSPGTKIYNPQIDWPSGTFALPKSIDGCPNTGEWQEGWRYQDTDNENNNNRWSVPIKLSGTFDNDGIRLEYCVKSTLSTGQTSWPQGKYCIQKKFDCPSGFWFHSIEWDDEDVGNTNARGGTLPDGQYDSDTIMHFCCRSDGNDASLLFPTDSSFVLLPLLTVHNSACPSVVGLHGERHYIYFDKEAGTYTLYYCYFHR